MPKDIERALKIASESHAGQVDKNDKPYILHPLAVAMNFRYDKKRFIAAILHDVVEDTDVKLVDLISAGFSKDIVEAIKIVTRKDTETYKEFIHRIELSDNEIAIDVKIADLIDNISRLDTLKDKDKATSLKKRYLEALDYLNFCKPNHFFSDIVYDILDEMQQ